MDTESAPRGRLWAAGLTLAVVAVTLRAFGPALGWGLTDADAWADVAWARHPLADQLLVKLTGGVGGDNANFWRPAAMLQFWVERALFGWAPAGWHAWDLSAHALATLALALYVHLQGRACGLSTRALTVLVTLLFAAHPLTEEIVPAVARNIDLLLGLGYFGAFGVLVVVQDRRRSGKPWSVAYGALLGLAALTLGAKEAGVLLAPLTATWILLFRDDLRWRPRLVEATRMVAPVAALILVYLLIRTWVMGGLGGYYEAGEVNEASWVDRTVQRAFIEPFVPSLSEALRPYRGWETWGPLAVLWGVVLWGAARSRHRRIAAFGAVWFLSFTLLFALTGTYSRRVWYVPTAGGMLVIVPAILYAWERRSIPGLALAAAWLATFVHGSPLFARYPDWGESAAAADAWRIGAPGDTRWASVPNRTTLWLVDRPYRVDLDPRRFRLWGGRSRGLAHSAVSYSLEARLDELYPERDLSVATLTAWYLSAPVAEQTQELSAAGDTLRVRRTGGARENPHREGSITVKEEGDTLLVTVRPGSRPGALVAVWTKDGPVFWRPGEGIIAP